jgi:hypothetical protein
MVWTVLYHDAFLPEMEALTETVQDELLTMVELLTLSGPSLGRPHVDSLAGSKHPNMKELRFNADDGVWRVAFAFDPKRRAMILVAGNKAGVAQKRFYKTLIAKAEARFADHLDTLKG